MAHVTKRIFATFTKSDRQADGTLIVSGIASSEAVDSDGEVIKADAMRKAITAYMEYANLREMHGNIAAGKVLKLETDAAGVTHIEALVVDAGSVLKVETGVLKGFSIGGRVPPGGRNATNRAQIDEIQLSEISLVDRPANPQARISFFKMDGADTEEDPVVEPVAAPPVVLVVKSLYSVGRLADLLSGLICVQQDQEMESQFAGDNSPLPSKLKDQIAALAGTLREVVGEETAVLVGEEAEKGDFPGHPFHGNQHAGGGDKGTDNRGGSHNKASEDAHNASKTADASGKKSDHQKAARAHEKAATAQARFGNKHTAQYHSDQVARHTGAASKAAGDDSAEDAVGKAGKKFSASTKDQLSKVHGMIDECSKAMHAIGYSKDEDETDDGAEKLAKAAALVADNEKLAKAAHDAGDALVKIMGERDALRLEKRQLEVQLATKGARMVVSVPKNQDNAAKGAEMDTEAPPAGTEARVLWEIKKSHKTGGRPIV